MPRSCATQLPSPASAQNGAAPPSLTVIYALLTFALLSLLGAALGIYGGLSKLANASNDVEHSYQRISAAQDILSIARDMETAQRGFLLTDQNRFLEPYRQAVAQTPAAWRHWVQISLPSQGVEISRIQRTFHDLSEMNSLTIALRRELNRPPDLLAQDVSAGKAKMDLLRNQITHYITQEQTHLRQLRREDDIAYNDAIVQALIGSLALILTGALLYAAMREARRAAGQSAALAEAADQRFKATFEQASFGIIHLSANGTPIMVNDALCSMTGYTRGEILAAGPGDPAYALDLLLEPEMRKAVTKGATYHLYATHVIQRRDGCFLPVASLLSAVRGSDGEIAFWSMMLRDISAQRAAEQQLMESQERLRIVQDEMAHIGRVNDLGEMAAAIAHEVNQPLTAISNYMSVAQRIVSSKSAPDDDLGMILGRVGEQAVRAGQIIRRMRSFIERREHVRSVEHVEELIDSAIDLALLGVDKSRVDIRHVRGAGDLQLRVDPVQIQQILLILLRNSMEAYARAHPKGRVKISIRTDMQDAPSDEVAIHVEDNGPGLDPDILARLFQPFVTTKPGNLGMGLPVSDVADIGDTALVD